MHEILEVINRLRIHSRDELHLVQSVRTHEPVYKNPSEIRADIRALLDERDRLEGELLWYRKAVEKQRGE